MASYRGRLRAHGLRAIPIEVTDSRDPVVGDRLRADVALALAHKSTTEGHAFVEAALADLADWRC
jgi:Protein  of unknown function (DUF3018)